MHLVMLTYSVFCYCDLDLEPMTLTYELCLGILKMHLHTKNEVCRSRLSKVRAQTGTQTDATESSTICFAGGKNKHNIHKQKHKSN